MPGYSGYAKSNNAVAAEEMGYYPASILARKLRVKTAAVKALMEPTEHHHTSKRYNLTAYYSLDEASDMVDELRAWKPSPVFVSCDDFRPFQTSQGFRPKRGRICTECGVFEDTHR